MRHVCSSASKWRHKFKDSCAAMNKTPLKLFLKVNSAVCCFSLAWSVLEKCLCNHCQVKVRYISLATSCYCAFLIVTSLLWFWVSILSKDKLPDELSAWRRNLLRIHSHKTFPWLSLYFLSASSVLWRPASLKSKTRLMYFGYAPAQTRSGTFGYHGARTVF